MWSTAGPTSQPWQQCWQEVILLYPNVLLSRPHWRSQFCLSVWICCWETWRSSEAGQSSSPRLCVLLVCCSPAGQTPGFHMFYCLLFFTVESHTGTLLPEALTFFLSFLQISLKTSMLQRWCSVLECQRSPDAPEALRMACAEALCVAGVPLPHSTAIMSRLEGSQTVFSIK